MTREKRKVYLEKRKLYRQKRRLYLQKKLWRISPASIVNAAVAIFIGIVVNVVSFMILVNGFVMVTAYGNIGKACDGYGTAVVFGAKVHEGGTLSHMLRDRMDTAIALYKEGSVESLLLSGDGSGEWSEVEYMKRYAVENGVAEDDIILDGEGYSTYETVVRAKKVYGVEKCVLVTQKYHLYRAVYIAESLDMDVVGAGADVRTYAGQLWRDIREVLARIKDFTVCLFD